MRKAAGILALLGALVVLSTDFGGWYTREVSQVTETSLTDVGQQTFYFFRGSDAGGAINLLTMPYGLAVLVLAGLLGVTGYFVFRPTRLPVPLWVVPAFAAGLTVVLGVVFVAVMVLQDPNDWWLDTGFYAALLTGGAAAFFLRRGRLATAG